MFIGHHAAALAAKRVEPRVSLGTLFAGALAAWLFVAWGWWIDKHRQPRT